MDGHWIEEELEAACRRSATAQEYLGEIMRIWCEAGFIRGEWSCRLGGEADG